MSPSDLPVFLIFIGILAGATRFALFVIEPKEKKSKHETSERMTL